MKNKKSKIFLTSLLFIMSFYVVSSLNLKNINFLSFNKEEKGFNYASAVSKEEIEVYPGGSCLGIKIEANGVTVVGFSDIEVADKKVESSSKKAGIELGDVILSIDGNKISNTEDLIESLSKENNKIAKVKIDREGKIKNFSVEKVKENKNDKGKIGLWVRDSACGIGTLTFYHAKTGRFGALGHPITDVDTNSIVKVKNGKLINSCVINVKKGQKGIPGELKSIFIEEDNYIGNVNKNTITGLFGEGKKDLIRKCEQKPIKIGFKEEVKEGKAQIISNIDQGNPKYYDIEIVKTIAQDKISPKSMIIKVTDSELLNKTGGIVQGMSGSPIIQNGKIIGAVTHVLVNKPDVGYGIYIEWMLKDAEIIK